MKLAVRAYVVLLGFDLYLFRGEFAALHERVRSYPLAGKSCTRTVKEVCDAVDLASLWYWKRVLCLQRAATTTCLLRSYGVPAEMVLGAQQMPFRAHAWVEVDGQVVNDKPYTPEMFAVLDRC